jgi:putative urate catabolism protein
MDGSGNERDFVGYGEHPPHAAWPGGARVAVSFVLNYEEGGERSPLDGDTLTEPVMHEIVGAPAVEGLRVPHIESMFDYGSRAGFWRVHRLFTRRGLPLTVYAVGQALERNPEAARAMATAGWEVIGHGWRWFDYLEVPEEVEREHIRRTNETIERLTGQRPLGWYTGRMSERTRRLAVAEGDLLYDSDSVSDELPYWVEVEGRPHLVVPYTLDCNDFKFLLPGGFADPEGFYRYMLDTFAQLYEEGAETPRLMNVGLHARIVGRPGRARALSRFLDQLAGRSDVWVATRAEIARHWAATHPPVQGAPGAALPD